MRSSRCLSSTATALRNIFITPLEATKPKPSLLLAQKWQSKAPLQSRRPYAYMVTPKEAPTKSRLRRDSEIKSWSILLVENGILSESKNTRSVLERLNPKTESLITVAEPTAEQPLPICKIINKEEEYKKLKDKKKKKKKNPEKTVKTLELNWAIDKGDLGHRLDKMRGFLGKGYKVELVLVKKRGKKSKPASKEQMEGLVQAVRGAIGEGGWKEHKEMEGKIGGQVLIFAQGKVVRKDGKEEEVEEEETEEGEDGEGGN